VRPFVHQEVQQLTELLGTLVGIYRIYDDQQPELHRSLVTLLDLTAAMYRDRGRPEKESHTASMKAELTTALRGVNPITLEKPPSRRHEMQSTIAFKVLQSLEVELRGSFGEATASLQQAEELIGQIILASVQKGLISDVQIRETITQAAIESLWRAIGADADIRFAQKRVLLVVSAFDASLLIDKVLTNLRAQLDAPA